MGRIICDFRYHILPAICGKVNWKLCEHLKTRNRTLMRNITGWEENIIVSLYEVKGVVFEQGNYRGLKLLDHVMDVLERLAENFRRKQVRINDIQFGFAPGLSTTDTIFIVQQLQGKLYAINNTVHDLCQSGKDIISCTQTCHLMGPVQARRRRVAVAVPTEHVYVWKHQKQSACWLHPEWNVQHESGRSPRHLAEALTVHHGFGSPLPRVSYSVSLGNPVWR